MMAKQSRNEQQRRFQEYVRDKAASTGKSTDEAFEDFIEFHFWHFRSYRIKYIGIDLLKRIFELVESFINSIRKN